MAFDIASLVGLSPEKIVDSIKEIIGIFKGSEEEKQKAENEINLLSLKLSHEITLRHLEISQKEVELQTKMTEAATTMGAAEAASQDKYVRYMRPTAGYMIIAGQVFCFISFFLDKPIPWAEQYILGGFALQGIHFGARSWEKIKGGVK